jgi:hypothetical protein
MCRSDSSAPGRGIAVVGAGARSLRTRRMSVDRIQDPDGKGRRNPVYTATRSYVTAGLVLTSAGVLAVGPITARPPAVEFRMLPVAASVAVVPTALETAFVTLAHQPGGTGALATLIEAFQNVRTDLSDGLNTTVTTITDTAQSVFNDIENAVTEILSPAPGMRQTVNTLGTTGNTTGLPTAGQLTGALATLIEAFRNVNNDLTNGIGTVLGTITDTAQSVVDDITGALINILEPNNNTFNTAATALALNTTSNLTNITGLPTGALATLIEAFRNVNNDLTNGIGTVLGTITDTAQSVVDDIADALINILEPKTMVSATTAATTALAPALASVKTPAATSNVAAIPTAVLHPLTAPRTAVKQVVVPTATTFTPQTKTVLVTAAPKTTKDDSRATTHVTLKPPVSHKK